jgi:Ca-activated chloride channel homolog
MLSIASKRCISWLLFSFFGLALISTASAQVSAPGNSTAPPPVGNAAAGATAGSDSRQPPTTGQEAPFSGQDSVQDEPGANSANDQGTMFVFKKEVEEIILHATVVDDQRRPVPSLERSAFAVFVNGVSQPITSFRHQDVPVAMGIIIDNSGSMRDKRDEVNRAVMNLIRASNPQDEIFVVNFSQNYYLDQDFTSDTKLLETALHQVSATGSTALYDAIVASAVHLMNHPQPDKKVLLVITDGQDNMSQETLEEASRRLQQSNGPTLYAVGLTGSGLQNRGREALQRLAQNTGGVAYFPASLDQVGDVTRTVAHDIRSQYMITYKPQNQSKKPNEQAVHVAAHAAGYGKLTVSSRSGQHQYAGEPAH